jgi:hypothetical protein
MFIWFAHKNVDKIRLSDCHFYGQLIRLGLKCNISLMLQKTTCAVLSETKYSVPILLNIITLTECNTLKGCNILSGK